MLLELEVMRCSLHCFLSVCVFVCPLAYPFPTFDTVDTTHELYSAVKHSNAVISLVLRV